MGKRVAVFGAGMGGLAVAHELVKHGFDVEVYEPSAEIGGKARSQYVAAPPASRLSRQTHRRQKLVFAPVM